jgi:hypothetical protein
VVQPNFRTIGPAIARVAEKTIKPNTITLTNAFLKLMTDMSLTSLIMFEIKAYSSKK